MLTFLSYIKHLTTGVCITEDPKNVKFTFFKKCIENITFQKTCKHTLVGYYIGFYFRKTELFSLYNWLLLSNMKHIFLVLFRDLIAIKLKKQMEFS